MIRHMYSTLVVLHIFAAMSWVGGMIFLSLVLAPLVRSRKAAPEFMALFRSAALRFRVVVWSAIALLLITGPMLLSHRGVPLLNPQAWPEVLRIKVGLIIVLLVLTAAHDLVLGPRVRQIGSVAEGSRSPRERLILRVSIWIPRLSLVVALAVVVAAAVLARS